MSVKAALPEGYDSFVIELKERIRHAQLRVALSINRELVLLYWSIGRDILARQKEQGWGAKVIDRLAADLRKAFPEMTGFSPLNPKYMRAFAEEWPDEQFVQQAAAQIPWLHNFVLLDQVKHSEERAWHIHQTIENGWSRNVLVHQIESGLYRRQGKALTNFTRTLPAPQSELAQQIVEDPYNFDFLTLSQEAQERELERGLLDHIRDFLLELGVEFAFVGSQYPPTPFLPQKCAAKFWCRVLRTIPPPLRTTLLRRTPSERDQPATSEGLGRSVVQPRSR